VVRGSVDPGETPWTRTRRGGLLVSAFVLGVVSGREGRLFRELREGEDKMARERRAIVTLQEIANAETSFLSRKDAIGTYGSLGDLVSAGLVAGDLSEGERDGYRFSVGVSLRDPVHAWAATAAPASARSGERSFATNQRGAVFWTKRGPFSVEVDWCNLPPGPPWTWPDPNTKGTGGLMRIVATTPCRGGLRGDR